MTHIISVLKLFPLLVLASLWVPGHAQDTTHLNLDKREPCFFAYQLFQQLAIGQQNLIEAVRRLGVDLRDVREQMASGISNGGEGETGGGTGSSGGESDNDNAATNVFVGELREEIRKISSDVGGLKEEIQKLSEESRNEIEMVTNIKDDVQTLTEDIADIKDSIIDIDRDITSSQQVISDLKDDQHDHEMQRHRDQDLLYNIVVDLRNSSSKDSSEGAIEEIKMSLSQIITVLQKAHEKNEGRTNRTMSALRDINEAVVNASQLTQTEMIALNQTISSIKPELVDIKLDNTEMRSILSDGLVKLNNLMNDSTLLESTQNITKALNSSHNYSYTMWHNISESVSIIQGTVVAWRDEENQRRDQAEQAKDQEEQEDTTSNTQCTQTCLNTQYLLERYHAELLYVLMRNATLSGAGWNFDEIWNSTVSSSGEAGRLDVSETKKEHEDILSLLGKLKEEMDNVTSSQANVMSQLNNISSTLVGWSLGLPQGPWSSTDPTTTTTTTTTTTKPTTTTPPPPPPPTVTVRPTPSPSTPAPPPPPPPAGSSVLAPVRPLDPWEPHPLNWYTEPPGSSLRKACFFKVLLDQRSRRPVTLRADSQQIMWLPGSSSAQSISPSYGEYLVSLSSRYTTTGLCVQYKCTGHVFDPTVPAIQINNVDTRVHVHFEGAACSVRSVNGFLQSQISSAPDGFTFLVETQYDPEHGIYTATGSGESMTQVALQHCNDGTSNAVHVECL